MSPASFLCIFKRLSPWISRRGRPTSIILTLPFIVFGYGVLVFSSTGSLAPVSDTSASAPPSTVATRWFNFSDDVFSMRPDERRLIVLHAPVDINTSGIETILQRHPRVVYFGDILGIQPEHLRYLQIQNSMAIIKDLFECSPQTLSYFVDHANAWLLGADQPPWCGSNRRAARIQQGPDANEQRVFSYLSCKTVRKSAVTSFCEHRHLAVKAHDLSWLDELASAHKDRLKVIDLTSEPTKSSDNQPLGEEPGGVVDVDSYFKFSYAKSFYIGDFHPRTTKSAALELYNFLDLYVNNELFNDISLLVSAAHVIPP